MIAVIVMSLSAVLITGGLLAATAGRNISDNAGNGLCRTPWVQILVSELHMNCIYGRLQMLWEPVLPHSCVLTKWQTIFTPVETPSCWTELSKMNCKWFQGFVWLDWFAAHSGVASALAGLHMTMPGDGLLWDQGTPHWVIQYFYASQCMQNLRTSIASFSFVPSAAYWLAEPDAVINKYMLGCDHSTCHVAGLLNGSNSEWDELLWEHERSSLTLAPPK